MATTKTRTKAGPAERSGADLISPERRLLALPSRSRPAVGYGLALAGTAALAGSFIPIRDHLTPVSEAFAFLVLVIAVAWIGGLGPGISASVLGFISFNFFFLPPYNRFSIERPEHVVVLFVLLGVSILISTLLARTRDRADTAESREGEIAILQELSRELVVRLPGPDAYRAVLARLVELLGFDSAALFVEDPENTRGLRELVSVGAEQGTLQPAAPGRGNRAPERVPLSVGRRNLGLLLLAGDREPLSPRESQVLRAFSDQLALVLERDRLLYVAARAESYRATEKLRRALLTAVSHDLRSPLSAIKTSVTDLLDPHVSPDPAYRRDVLASIDKEVDRLNLLIANLLDMSRIETGMLRARMQAVDLGEVVAQSVDLARRRWQAIHFNVSVDERAKVVRADPVFLDRVITNLLDNAGRSAAAAGDKDVDVEGRINGDGRVTVRVIDHGLGVPALAREHLFHPFYDLDERSPRLGPGLGLAICKGFVVSMGEDIWVEETPGGGATFAFSLGSMGAP